jgi:hypothetical protein
MDTLTKTPQTRRKFSKFIRHPERYGLQLQERDLDILELVYDYRFIPSDQVVQLIEGSERKILDRLKKLFNHQYLERMCDRRIRTQSGSEKMVYAITARAAQLLVDERGLEIGKVNWASKNRTVTDRHIKHTLMIGKFRTAVTLAVAAKEDLELLFWKEHRGTGQQLNPELLDSVTLELEKGREERRKIVPDAFLGLEDSDYEYFLYLEADRSTMTNDRFKKKLSAYWAWWKQGGSKKKHQVENFRVLTLTPSVKRRDNLRKAAIEASPGKNGSGMFWFACEKDYNVQEPETVLGDIWVTAKDDEKHSLLE